MSVSQALPLTAKSDLSKDSIVFLQVQKGVAGSNYVKMLTGKDFILGIGPGDTVNDLKLKLSHREGLPSDQQRFIC